MAKSKMDTEIQIELEQILSRQEKLGTEIEALIKNYKKDSSDRKTPSYYEKRLNQMKALMTEFNANDEWLQGQEKQLKSADYFKGNYNTQISNLADQYINIFKNALTQQSNGASDKTSEITKSNNTNNSITSLIRRQSAMISSLRRLIQANVPEDAAAPSLKAKEKLWEQIQEVHFNIFENSEDPEEHGYDMDAYMDLEVKVMQNFASAKHTQDSPSKQCASAHPIMNVSLPKINIPKFDGTYTQWQTFSDLFEKVIHEQHISPVQKMWYLKTNLTGEAERLIRHLALTDNNYQTAWTILKDRFNNKRIITASIVQQIVEHPNVTSDAGSIKGYHDVIQENMAALENLGVKTDNWDPLLLHILTKKLDRHTHMLYETSITNPTELQSITDLLHFLQQRFQALESMGYKQSATRDKPKVISSVAVSNMCKCCDTKEHPLYFCDKFKSMTPSERLNWVQQQRLCVNCFKADHKTKFCKSRSCPKCQKRHNSLVHLERSTDQQQSATQQPTTIASALSSVSQAPIEMSPTMTSAYGASTTNNKKKQSYVLLATAKVRISANNGQSCEARAILDSGSQVNLVTQKLIKQLSLTTTKSDLSIQGIGLKIGNSKARVSAILNARSGGYSTRFEAYVIPQIISAQPSQNLDVQYWDIPEGIELADPDFFITNKIDMLIGAEFYHELLHPQQISIGKDQPILQKTSLGWIVTGKTRLNSASAATCAVMATEEQRVAELMEKFWTTEELTSDEKHMTAKEKLCETHFTTTVARDKDGKFVVRLPFAENPSALGKSQAQAEKRFLSIERRLRFDSNLQIEYKKFMQEYEDLGHMERIKQYIPSANYFIPHHCVLKPDSTTTKLRVVFDASAKTSTQRSLNDILHKGPTVQSELFSILLRFRWHKYVFTADIEKMYRQIRMHHQDSVYQLIVWRNEESEDLKYYRLNTVTYGTTSAPYLATKCLQYLATQNKANFPLGSAVVQEDFYVDDCLSGANDIDTAQEMQRQTTALLKEAGFKLRKWCTNSARLLSDIPFEDQEINLDLEKSSKDVVKTLGLIWRPKSDELYGRASLSPMKSITKRTVSSDIARIFDPLGLFGPITVSAKVFMQQLHVLRSPWDEQIPEQLQQQWMQFRNELAELNDIKAHRHVFNGKVPNKIQIHTFVDASEKAFGAAIYLRAMNPDKTISVQLLCAKSRVAPIKKLTIPRLELCAAVLGAELTSRVRLDLKCENTPTFLWSDSEIVLSWIQSPSATLHTFVANRSAKIQQLTNSEQWHHVPSKDNPADILSRGTNPKKLRSHAQWFYGPLFLYGNKEWWIELIPKYAEFPNDIERRQQRVVAITHKTNGMETILYNIDHKNNFRFLQNTVAYLRRPFVRPRSQHLALSPAELQHALQLIVKMVQTSEFAQELKDLKKHKAVSHSSQLSSLTPFIDSDGILRVGGRLESSALPFDSKHPMVLPYNDPLVKLLFKIKHEENKQRFWPIKGKITARNIVHSCTICSRAKPKLLDQLMGNLPEDRVTVARPFFNTGVDYCGPFKIHYKVRGKKPTKAYLAIFCCFSTKAVHLELVTDLTTNAFLGALHRFVGRRGLCKTIYCDNATNFVGAKNQLEELQKSIFEKTAQERIIRDCSSRGITFKFIPPRSPHFGGLWEAAVKSAKYLLLRDVTSANLCYEELETVVVGVEAILNSRPLTPMSSDPNDLSALTPGHFLIGEPLTSIPDQNKDDVNITAVQRWELVAKLKYDFWARWSTEYLNELQHRHKWKVERENVKEHDMVIIKEDNLPVMNWPIGIIVKVYKGKDGLVRDVDVKTSKGIFNRPLRRLAPLPTASALNTQDDQFDPDNTTNIRQPLPRAPTTNLQEDTLRNKLQPPTDSLPHKRPRTCH